MRTLARLCLVLCLVALVACGDGKEEPGVSPGPTEPAPVPTPEPTEPAPTPEPTESKSERLAGEFVDSLGLEKQYPQLAEEIVTKSRKIAPDMNDEEAAGIRAYVLDALKADFRGNLIASMVEYFTEEELQAMKDREMTPGLEKKLPGWQEFSRVRGQEWGERVGREAAEKVLGEK